MAAASGVLGSPSPVCQMPAPRFWNRGALVLPSEIAVWKPHFPSRLYSQIGTAGKVVGVTLDELAEKVSVERAGSQDLQHDHLDGPGKQTPILFTHGRLLYA